MTSKTYYELLGVERTASFEEIKRAFRVKAKEFHPDHHSGEKEAEEKFKKINEAYDVLKDEQKRAAYDRYGHEAYVNGMNGARSGGAGFGGFDFSGSGFESIFEEMFQNFGGGAARQTHQRGEDVRFDLEISLAEAYAGVKKTITVETFVACEKCAGKGGKDTTVCPTCSGRGHVRQRQGFFVMETECPTCRATGKVVKDPCAACHGTGRVRKKRTLEVNVPAGVDTGIRMRLAGEGNAGLNGLSAGDLYVFLRVQEHEIFKRQGDDLFCEIPVSMVTAALGGDVFVPTMDGKGQHHDVKPGLQSGERLRLKGLGMPMLKSFQKGDLYVTFKVETPTKLTSRQKELLAEFAKESGDNQQACQDFFCRIKKIWDNL